LAVFPFFPFTTFEVGELRRSRCRRCDDIGWAVHVSRRAGDLLCRGVPRRGARAAWVVIPESERYARGGLINAVLVANRSEDGYETPETRRRHGAIVWRDIVTGVLRRDGPGSNEQAVRDTFEEFVGQAATSPFLFVSGCGRQRVSIAECVGPDRRDVSWRELLLEHHGSPELRLRNLEEASWRDSSLDAFWRDSSLDVVASHGCDLKDDAQGAVRGDAAVYEALSDSEDETLVAEQDRVCGGDEDAGRQTGFGRGAVSRMGAGSVGSIGGGGPGCLSGLFRRPDGRGGVGGSVCSGLGNSSGLASGGSLSGILRRRAALKHREAAYVRRLVVRGVGVVEVKALSG
jgi:hypothetical protein